MLVQENVALHPGSSACPSRQVPAKYRLLIVGSDNAIDEPASQWRGKFRGPISDSRGTMMSYASIVSPRNLQST